jgi:hypothetical protein
MTTRKDFPVFDCDGHVVEPPAIWDEYVPARERAWVKTQFCFHTDGEVLLGALGQARNRPPDAGQRRMAGALRPPARLPRAARPPRRHGRARH